MASGSILVTRSLATHDVPVKQPRKVIFGKQVLIRKDPITHIYDRYLLIPDGNNIGNKSELIVYIPCSYKSISICPQ